MAVPYVKSFGAIKLAIWRAVEGEGIRAGTATSGGATTLVSTSEFLDATDNDLVGRFGYIRDGAGQSRSFKGTAFATGTDTLTIAPSGTALDSTSVYVLSRRFSHDLLLEAMRSALSSLGRYSKEWEDQSLIAGSPLVNATFYDNSGTFPNGWTRTGTGGTFARESTIAKHGRYSASILSNGTDAAGIRQDIPNVGLYRGKSLILKGWVNTNTTGSRVNLTLDDGIDTTTGLIAVTTANRGWGTAMLETPALTISDRATRLRISCNITAGGAVTAYFSGLYLSGGPYWREVDMPAGSPTAIEYIKSENSEEGPFGIITNPPGFSVVRETTRRLRLETSGIPLGRIMHLVGRTSWSDFATAASDDDTNFEGWYDWLVAESAYELLLSSGSSHDERLMLHLKARADANRPFATKFPAGAVAVEF